MEVEIRVVPEREEPVVVLEVPEAGAAAEELAARIRAMVPEPVTGWQGDRAVLLPLAAVLRFYAADKGVYAQRAGGEEYTVRTRLYELEERLAGQPFARISQSEIVNLKQVTALDLSLSGTIKITLAGGTQCYASRRYVKKMKQALGL